jgi:hypothetical protein
VCPENAFEAGALEEYLIGALKPEENGRSFPPSDVAIQLG